MKFRFSKPVAPCDFPPKNLYFPLPQESMRTTFHYPESPYGRTYADVITQISRMDSLPNYLSYRAPLARFARARSSPIIMLYPVYDTFAPLCLLDFCEFAHFGFEFIKPGYVISRVFLRGSLYPPK